MKRDKSGALNYEVLIEDEWKVICRKCLELVSWDFTVRGGCKFWYRVCMGCWRVKTRKYLKNYTPKNRDGLRKSWRGTYHRQKRRNPERMRARYLVQKALQNGTLIKHLRCEVCTTKTLLDGHHDDYSKPFEVKWLCRGCHIERHRTVGMAWGRPQERIS